MFLSLFFFYRMSKQAEAEVVPSLSLVEVEVGVEVISASFYASAMKHLGIGMSVGRSVGQLVGQSVRRSVGYDTTLKKVQNVFI